MTLSNSELILNKDGSIYHLNLHPEDISDTIITVGDPDRVAQVSQYFDRIELKKGKREFVTHTGTLNGKRLTVISTGIGTDNMDIVMNELDALANIDFERREIKENRIRLRFIRIGTAGTVQPKILVDSWVLTEFAVGLDGLLHFYDQASLPTFKISKDLTEHLGLENAGITPYAVECDRNLAAHFEDNRIRFGITLTNSGFYAPQGRMLRCPTKIPQLIPKLRTFSSDGRHIANLEMETSGLYGLARLLGHGAVSLSAILANRISGQFSKNPAKIVEELIQFSLERITAPPPDHPTRPSHGQ